MRNTCEEETCERNCSVVGRRRASPSTVTVAMMMMGGAVLVVAAVMTVASPVSGAVNGASTQPAYDAPVESLIEWKQQQGEAFTHFESGELCSCLQGDAAHPFEIDCGREDMEHVLEAWNVLTTNPECMTEEGCLNPANNSTCRQSFFVVQSHHDHCSHSDVPTEVEKGYHDYDEMCWHCLISRRYSPSHDMCPEVDCNEVELADFASSVLQTACGVVDDDAGEDGEIESCCETEQTQSAFKLVLALHDACGPTAPPIVDKLLHDYEYACEDYFCNSSSESYRADLCPFNQYEGETNTTSGPSDDVFCPDEDLERCKSVGANACYVAPAGENGFFDEPVSVCWWTTSSTYEDDCVSNTNGLWVMNSDDYGGFLPPSEGFPQCVRPCAMITGIEETDAGACILCGSRGC